MATPQEEQHGFHTEKSGDVGCKLIGIPTVRGWKTNSRKHVHFKDCWKMCENLERNPRVFQPLCRKRKICYRGCQTACASWHRAASVSGRRDPAKGQQKQLQGGHSGSSSSSSSSSSRRVDWQFQERVVTDTDYMWISMHWPRPTPLPPVPLPHPIVYSILMREEKNDWRFIQQTYEQQYNMRHDEAPFVPEFLIEAIDETGVIAGSVFNVSKMLFTNVIRDTGALGEMTDKVNLTHSLTYEDEDGLEARLTWSHPRGVGGPGRREQGEVDYEVVHILKRCGIYDTAPRCLHTEDLFTSDVVVKLTDKPQYSLKKLLFNTRYWVRIQLANHGPPDGQLAFLTLDTPRCDQPSDDFRRCFLPSDVTPHTVTSPNVTGPANVTMAAGAVSTVSSLVTVTEDEDGLNDTDDYSLTELIRDIQFHLVVPKTKKPRGKHHPPRGDPRERGKQGKNTDTDTDPPSLHHYHRPGLGDEDRVLVNVSWTYISDLRHVNFSLTFSAAEAPGTHVLRQNVTGVTHVVVSLMDNTVYDMVIDLVVPPDTLLVNRSGSRESGAGSAHRDWGPRYLDDSRQRRTFNTSTLQLAARERHQAVRMKEKNLKAVNGVMIGMACVVVFVVIAFVTIFLYKKRQSFKDIIIPKTTVAKSNSYKSSVGGKGDYSNQLMVFCDEWELDPQLLKFSTPLGQGAFGKVVTGYYSDHKVAIKLVKEGAPLSYREDLVAEIQLMKRLGTHPNIVCLVGACTITEPIALVMEYVPYGNLQNFLKKCRLEGDLQKRADGPSEIQYSMLQDCGGIENGVITPTDMLSFARQVAMAMEYLAEKKYVHRDLAARNILLHYNKVVKVCDFGLSRDIFHDNQYKKLTNGKLPLKWMAIESLRDRVFTTQSDVWSFGILLWEIVTMGASPYPNIALADLYYVLSNHYRMDKPSNCSSELYGVMRRCWAEQPQDRPCFTQLREQLESLMSQDRDYLVLEDIDVPLSTSESSSNPTAPDLFSGEMLPSQAARHAVSVSSYESGSSSSAATTTTTPSTGLLKQQQQGLLPASAAGSRRPPITIDVCIHQKSTERLMRPSESDSSP
ncbi:uncharacterized protein LOC143281407 [Babylonia areolata]|uniref:uncharacterized protein LOC143281407 n=1 Tax=Babylonia areolata TaxID=304850 RepID=UPI003FD30BEC